MSGGQKPRIRTIPAGTTLLEQGAPGTDVFLILDGIFVVEVDGEQVAEIGPGAVVGERAALEGGLRTATLRATTAARVAEVPAEGLDTADLRGSLRRATAGRVVPSRRGSTDEGTPGRPALEGWCATGCQGDTG